MLCCLSSRCQRGKSSTVLLPVATNHLSIKERWNKRDTTSLSTLTFLLQKAFCSIHFGAKNFMKSYLNFCILITSLANPLFICTWFLKSLVHKIDFWTWFFVYFKLDFYCLQKSSSKQTKNQVQKSIWWNRDFQKSSTDR